MIGYEVAKKNNLNVTVLISSLYVVL